jgi:hypothetical protein
VISSRIRKKSFSKSTGGKSLVNAESLLEKEEKLSDHIRLFCIVGEANPFLMRRTAHGALTPQWKVASSGVTTQHNRLLRPAAPRGHCFPLLENFGNPRL